MKKNSVIQQVNAGGSKPKIPAKKLRAAFTAAGLRMTRQRLTVYRELAGRSDHPDVELLYKAVKKQLPKISLFTVYRTMNMFESVGLVMRVATWKGHARYSAKMDQQAHFLCETCGRISNVKVSNLGELAKRAIGNMGKVNRVSLMFYGNNPFCSAKRSKKTRIPKRKVRKASVKSSKRGRKRL